MEIFHIGQSNGLESSTVHHSSPQKESKTTSSFRKPLSSICANQTSSNSSNNLKDSVTKSGRKIRTRINADNVPKGKGSTHRKEQEDQSNSTSSFGDIFRSISPSKAFVWRDEWNLRPANNINPEEHQKDVSPSELSELYETHLVDSSSLESTLSAAIQKPKSIHRSGPSEDFWADEMQDMLTLRIANPIDESDDEE